MSNYTPELPPATSWPCPSGEPWRVVDGVTQCLTLTELPPTGAGSLDLAIAVAVVLIVTGVLVTVLSLRKKEARA